MIELKLKKKLSAAEGEMLLDINLHLKQGEFVAIYGESGSGKTSILRMIAGLLSPDSGQIIAGKKVWLDSVKNISLKPQQRKTGFVFQDHALFPNMSVRENLSFALDKNQDASIVDELLDMVELGELQHRKPQSLSGGQQQRTALARALVRRPGILMLDEPFSSLDSKIRTKLQTYILKVHKQFQLTTILVSHDIGEIIRMADRVLVLKNGKIDKVGKPIEVFIGRPPSEKLQLYAEIIDIQKEDKNYVLSVLLGSNLFKIRATESELEQRQIGDQILLDAEGFEPKIAAV